MNDLDEMRLSRDNAVEFSRQVLAQNEDLKARLAASEAEVRKYCAERDEALAKWHGHQKNVPCVGCAGGHDTFWLTVIQSPQWKAWWHGSEGWDVPECEACGHISQEHFQAFMAFALAPEIRKREEAERSYGLLVAGIREAISAWAVWDDHARRYLLEEGLEKIESILPQEKKSQEKPE